MKFLKPPVVEVWISIDFDPNENKREPLDLRLVQEYMKLYREELPTREALHEQTITVEEVAANELPRVTQKDVRVQSVRLWNPNRSLMVQLGDDQFAFHVLKTPEDTPGYSKVREAAQPKLDEYVRVFQPTQIRHATLHYLDIIDIPRPASGKVNLSDYFPQAVDLPEVPFGPITALNHQFQVMCPVDEGPLFFRLQNLPSPPEQNVFRFRLEWHKQSVDVNTLDLAQVWQRMDVAHDYMWDCFNAALSPSTLNLFEPIHETEET